ncbi:uncharacterized protein DS421_19g650590 [Arachis hypogaea]|uniref:Uncharacterized protein n=1 Tax=Arachis hypogaea TaxID=3818 RepID=A0A6B9V943_ARAHY|nr:uncharacterized protein DS421_19g650590 [Arachis hypogaea]
MNVLFLNLASLIQKVHICDISRSMIYCSHTPLHQSLAEFSILLRSSPLLISIFSHFFLFFFFC